MNDNKRIIWFWQSNPNPWDEKEPKKWKRFSDFENNYIEEGFQRKQKEVEIDEYVIDLEWYVQFNKKDKERQRPIERREIELSQFVREERFSYPIRVMRSYDNGWDKNKDFETKWEEQNKQLIDEENYEAIAELAAKGKRLLEV